MANDNTTVVDEDEALLGPIRERVRATQPEAMFQLLKAEARIGPVVLRSPTETEFSVWQRALEDETTKQTATRNLFMTLLMYPTPVAMAAALTRLPGYISSKQVQDALKYLTGMGAQAAGKG